MIRRLRERDGEEGFTITELAVALGIMFVSLMALAQTAVIGFNDTALARQRQAANQIANQVIEEVRGLPYDTVRKGLSSDDLTGDPNIVSCAEGYHFRVCPPDPAAEEIVHTPGLADVTPLVPHRGTFGPPEYPSAFEWSVYVTEAADAPAAGGYRVWSIVEWDPIRPGVRGRIENQTVIFAPEGCVDTATHPFGAPCQPFHLGTATVAPGGATTTGTVGAVVFDAFMLDLLSASSSVQVEQVSLVDGSLTLPGVRRVVSGGETQAGRSFLTTQADTDPATPAEVHDHVGLTSGQSGGSLAASDTSNQLTATAAGTDTGESTSTPAASATNPCTTQNDERPCGYQWGRHNGGLSMTLKLPSDAGQAAYLRILTDSTPTVTYVRRHVPIAGQNGLVRSRVERVIPEIQIGELPTKASAPPGWQGYWVRLINYTATLQAEAGTNTSEPTRTVGGQVEFWNGSGYSVTAVTEAGATITPAALNVPVNAPGFGTGTTEISGTVEIQPSTLAETVGDVATTRTSARAVAGSPLVAEVSYRVTRASSIVADLTVSVDLGRAAAESTYTLPETP